MIPNFENIKVVDENGMFTPEWKNIMTVLFQTLQQNMNNEGLLIPSQISENIDQLTSSQNGTLVYDSTNNVTKVCVNGTFKTIQTD